MKKISVGVVQTTGGLSYSFGDFIRKVLRLEASYEHIYFRKAFKIPDDGLKGSERRKWAENHMSNRTFFDNYMKRLQVLKNRFGFKDYELATLEDYLQTGDPIVVTVGSSEKYRPTRSWDNVSLVRNVQNLRDEFGMSYKEVKKHLEEVSTSQENHRPITEVGLRKMMSRSKQILQRTEAK